MKQTTEIKISKIKQENIKFSSPEKKKNDGESEREDINTINLIEALQPN